LEFASALCTTGLSPGIVWPDAPAATLWILAGGMFLGRLELFAVIVGLIRLASDLPVLISSISLRRS
jgi:trk system potassium uptake protein TrkH